MQLLLSEHFHSLLFQLLRLLSLLLLSGGCLFFVLFLLHQPLRLRLAFFFHFAFLLFLLTLYFFLLIMQCLQLCLKLLLLFQLHCQEAVSFANQAYVELVLFLASLQLLFPLLLRLLPFLLLSL